MRHVLLKIWPVHHWLGHMCHVAAETLETPDLALRVKEMVFAEAKKIMDAGEVEEGQRKAA